MLKKLFSHTLIYAIGPKLPLLGGILILPIITKDLTEKDFGTQGWVLVVVELMLGLKFLGLEQIFIQVYYQQREDYKSIWSDMYGFLQAYLVPFVIVTCLFIYLFVPFDNNHLLWTSLVLISGRIFTDLTSMIGNRLTQLSENPITITKISVIAGFINLFVLYLTISVYKLGYLGWFYSSFISGLIMATAYFVILKRHGVTPNFSFRMKKIRPLLKDGFPLIPNKYGMYLLDSSDKAIMKFLGFSVDNVGFYTAGYSLGKYADHLKTAISFGIAPMLFKKISDDKTDEGSMKLVEIVAAVFLAITFCAAVWAKEITDFLMSNPDLKGVYPIVLIVIMAQNYAPLRYYYTNFMLNENRPHVFWRITLYAGLINVVINVIFLVKYGVIVAAISTFVGYLFMTYYGYYLKAYREVKEHQLDMNYWVLIITLATILAYSLMDSSAVLKLSSCLAASMVLLIGFLVFRRSWIPKEFLS